MTLMGLATEVKSLAAARFFLGAAESPLFPCLVTYLCFWYPRYQQGLRISLFYSAATLAGAFGGLLAFAINLMAGTGGKGGWAWIFILEGLATVLVGIAAFWLVYDFPETAKCE